jgi:hypothetical protein
MLRAPWAPLFRVPSSTSPEWLDTLNTLSDNAASNSGPPSSGTVLAFKTRNWHRCTRKGNKMDLLLVLILLLLLFGGGGGLYWGLGVGWGIGPIGLIVLVIVVAYLLYGYRGRRGPPL